MEEVLKRIRRRAEELGEHSVRQLSATPPRGRSRPGGGIEG